MPVIEVKIYFDFICAWCPIGHRSLQRAIDLYQTTYPDGRQDTFTYTFMPFYLRPHAIAGVSTPLLEAMEEKNGPSRTEAIRKRVDLIGKDHGIEFSYDSRIGSTRDAHRLLRFATPEQRETLLETLYTFQFEQDGDITSLDALADAANDVGLDRGEVIAFLNGREYAEEVDQLAGEARSKDGVSSVPTVFIAGRRVEGAGDVGDFLEAIVAAREGEAV